MKKSELLERSVCVCFHFFKKKDYDIVCQRFISEMHMVAPSLSYRHRIETRRVCAIGVITAALPRSKGCLTIHRQLGLHTRRETETETKT
jgi:hypothetical protein